MLRIMLKGIFAAALIITVPSFADVNDTREVLSYYCNDNPKVLEVYDRVASSWTGYEIKFGDKWDLEKLLKAVEYSAEKHVGQVRKNAEKTPYIIHPIGVSELLWDLGDIRSVNVLAAALLHDTLEDTDATEQEILELFGERILYTVKEVTNDPSLSSQENKQRQVDHAPMMSLDGQLVKLADRLYNVRDLETSPPGWSNEKIDEYYRWGEKLLFALRGTNKGLEYALQQCTENHKIHESTQKNSVSVQHRIKGMYFEWDPYTGNSIYEYIFVLDDNSKWMLYWSNYERNHLSLRVDDVVEIIPLGEDQYLMITPSKEGIPSKSITFEKVSWEPNCYYAI